MPFEVQLTQRAAREFRALPPSVQRRFADALDALADGPLVTRPGVDVRRLHGVDAWRLRVGAYRGVFAAEPGRLVFTRFGHRSRIYEW